MRCSTLSGRLSRGIVRPIVQIVKRGLTRELSLQGNMTRICIVRSNRWVVSETFIDDHASLLPGQVTVVHGIPLPHIGDQPVLSQSILSRAQRKILRMIGRRQWEWETTAAYLAAFRRSRAQAVLAEYGPIGVGTMDACRLAGIPLIVHFHGYDSSVTEVLDAHSDGYQLLFRQAAAIIAVSHAEKRKLISLGAVPEKIHYNPCGVDCDLFTNGNPGQTAPVFLAVGRFVEKKAPHLTLLAFAQVYRQAPETRLRMIGEGPLLGTCRDLARALGIENAVNFLGAKTHETVRMEMSQARAFVQHSVEASNGDCEGMPVSILEASATGIPVVSTRHGGIPDAVIEGQTGLLVDERDVAGMAQHMLQLAKHPALADQLGRAARAKMRSEFSMERSISRLWYIIESCITNSLRQNSHLEKN